MKVRRYNDYDNTFTVDVIGNSDCESLLLIPYTELAINYFVENNTLFNRSRAFFSISPIGKYGLLDFE